MADERTEGGTLDLSTVEPAPLKVRLGDGRLYDMQNPETLGPLPLQRLLSRYRRARAILDKDDATEADVEEMMELLADVSCVVLPDAPREQIGRLSLPRHEKLIQAFFDASPAADQAGEAVSTSAS